MAHHWAIFDKDRQELIEFSKVDGKGAIIARPLKEWKERWKNGKPQYVSWTNRPVCDPVFAKYDDTRNEDNGRAIVDRARSKLGTEVKYALFARSNDSSHMNCEAFARWCNYKMSRSSQAEFYLPKFLLILIFLIVMLLIL